MKLIVNYELARQPYSVGDVLSTALCSRIVAEDRNSSERAFCFVLPKVLAHMPEGSHFEGTDLLPRFAGIKDIFYSSAAPDGDTWPALGSEYIFYHCNALFLAYFKRKGVIPSFEDIGGYEDRGYVSINLRCHGNQTHRDSKAHAWFEMMDNHRERHFVVIGDVKPPALPNVTYLQGDIQRDLSAVQHSDFHMGTISGPCEIVRFSTKPYACFGPMVGEISRGMPVGKSPWAWSNERQRWICEPETVENLEREYQRLAA